MKKNIFNFIILFLLSCLSPSEELKKHVMSLEYHFKITRKSKDRLIEFEGKNAKGELVKFSEFEQWTVYSFVEIGDTIVKELNHTEIKLIKKDTTILFPLMYSGKVLE
jgi:hypothetical protein